MENKSMENKTKEFQAVSVNLHEIGKEGNTLLHLAAAQGDLTKLRYLINRHPDLIETKNKFGSTPLHYATWNGQLESARYLVEQGADLTTKDNYNQSLIHVAAWNGYLNLLKYFFNKTSFSLETKDMNGNTPLLASIYANNNFNVLKFLIAHGADVKAKNNEGDTALMLTTKNGYRKAAKYLVDEGKADLFIKDNDENTLLHLAVMNEHLNLIKYFISKGLDINAKNYEESTPLHLAVDAAQSLKLVKHLVRKGADINVKNADGYTPLHRAVEINEAGLAVFLLSKGSNVNVKNVDGKTPLQIAVENKEKNLVEYLIKKGAQLDQESANYVQIHEISIPEKSETLSGHYVLEQEVNSTNASSVRKKAARKHQDNVKDKKEDVIDDNFFPMKELNESLASLSNTTGFFRNYSTEAGAYALSSNASSSADVNTVLANYPFGGFIP